MRFFIAAICTVSLTSKPCTAVDGIQPTNLEWSNSSCHEEFDRCAQLEFCGSPGGVFGYRIPGVTSCSVKTAPVIRMHPGLKYELILRNTATEITNIHLHGVHLSGDGNGDDVTRHAQPGECILYNWTITSDQMGGTFWYHSHIHGLSKKQVQGGGFGLVIIEDPSSYANDPDIQSWMGNDLLLSTSLSLSGDILGNGGVQNFDVVADSWYRLRLLTVDPSAKGDTVFFEKCEFRQVAADGIYFNQIPHAEVTAVEISGAGRADFAVKCSDSGGTIKWRGTNSNNIVATFNIISGPAGSASPFKVGNVWSPSRPNYVADLRNENVDSTHEFRLSATAVNDISWDANTAPYMFRYGDVQEWSLYHTMGHPFHLHIFHMQIVTPGGCGPHLEGEWYDTIFTNGMGSGMGSGMGGTSMMEPCKVRFRMIDFSGRTVLHCHILQHEDQGAMMWVDIFGGPPPVGHGSPVTCSSLSSCQATSCTKTEECGSTIGLDNCGNPCIVVSTDDCPVNEKCVQNVCKSTLSSSQCVKSNDCMDGQLCINNQCGVSSGLPKSTSISVGVFFVFLNARMILAPLLT